MKVETLFLLKELKLLSYPALLVLKKLLLELIYLFLFVFVNVIELRLFKIIFARFIHTYDSHHALGTRGSIAKAIGWDSWLLGLVLSILF